MPSYLNFDYLLNYTRVGTLNLLPTQSATRANQPNRSAFMKSAILLQLCVGLGVCIHAQALELSRFLSHEAMPASIEQASMGASIASSSGVENAAALISSTSEKPAVLSGGIGVVTLKLAKQSQVRQLTFLNDGAAGRLVVSASTDNMTWVPMASTAFASGDDVVDLGAGASYSKYLRLSFELSKPGSIAGLKVVGEDYDADYQVSQGGGQAQEFNFASGVGGARLIYASATTADKGATAWRQGVLRFDARKASEFVAVYDLGQKRRLGKFGCSHGAGLTAMSVYTFSALPEKENWRGRLAYDTAALGRMTPVVSVEAAKEARGTRLAEVKEAVEARYVAFKWTVAPGLSSFPVYGTVIGGQAVVVRSPAVHLASAGQFKAGAGRSVGSVAALDKAAYAAAPSVFAWDLERGLFGAAGHQGSMARADGLGASGSAVYSRSTRKADGEENPEDIDPVSVEILRCDIVSE